MTWKNINWQKALKAVRHLQAEIVRAELAGNQRKVIMLQDRLLRSRTAKLLAVHQVTSNSGRHTPGVDGEVWNSPERKMRAVERLEVKGYKPQPARRVMIPKDENRMRPLGILTMYDRAMQALHLLALDPIAETRADPHSYGFRKYRSTADAILSCADIFASKDGPQWVLEADIEECFDTISHTWLLQHIPLEKFVLRGWLKAGYLEKGRFHKTTKGLPQGGIISPTLTNMTLDGMERMLVTYFHHSPTLRERSKISFVRYADDFIVASASKKILNNDVKSLLTNFLKERGMRFSIRKTIITHITGGFEFLGCHLVAQTSLFGGYTLKITPSAKSFHNVLKRLEQTIQKYQDNTVTQLIQKLNPIIRGWVIHYTYVESQEVFTRLDQEMYAMLLKWAKRRHPRKLKRWLKKTYFTRLNEHPPVFTDHQEHTLYRAQDTSLIEYVPITPECNAYDPKWKAYLARRQEQKGNVHNT
jgi:RNA-directed DNA polymerase